MNRKARFTVGAGLSLGVLAAPAAAEAEDLLVTNLNDSGSGSLRDAIDDASGDADADRILFKSKLSGQINLTSAPLYIYGGDLEILGPGARKLSVSGGDDQTVFTAVATFSGFPPIDAGISGLTVTDGSSGGTILADDGGGIMSYGEVDLTLSQVTVSGNTAVDDGGGIFATLGSAPSAGVSIEDSTISGNSTADDGGGVYARYLDFSVENSTISGNSAADFGGGAYMYEGTSPAAFEVRNSTVTNNRAGYAGGLYEATVGVTLRGTIVAGNTGGDLDDGPWATSFSLIGDTSSADITDQGGNLLDVDPKLKPLKDNGGPTDTHAIKKSPAKNAGPSDAPGKDQRGAPRKGQPDIGAYELAKCGGVIVNRVGTEKKDKLKGTKKKDGILGLGGKDKLKGKKGKDGLCGGGGKDTLKGGPGKDKLKGGPGKDKEVQ